MRGTRTEKGETLIERDFSEDRGGRKSFQLRGEDELAESGFSLVEIVVALGIFSFCVLTIVGLMSVALDSSKTSLRDSATIGILRYTDAFIRQKTALNPGTTPGPLYFDTAGKPVDSTSADSFYKVTITAITGLPSSTSSSTTLRDAADPDTAKDASNNARPLYLWSVLVAPQNAPPNSPEERQYLLGNTAYK